MAKIVADLVVAETIKVVFMGALERYLNQTRVKDKLDRLNTLVLEVGSAVEISLEFNIESGSLLQWQQELCEVRDEGESILKRFRGGGSPSSSYSSSPFDWIKKFVICDNNSNELNSMIKKLEGMEVEKFLTYFVPQHSHWTCWCRSTRKFFQHGVSAQGIFDRREHELSLPVPKFHRSESPPLESRRSAPSQGIAIGKSKRQKVVSASSLGKWMAPLEKATNMRNARPLLLKPRITTTISAKISSCKMAFQ